MIQTQDYWRNISTGQTPATTPIDEGFWRFFVKGDELLEVGCGWGRIIYECLRRGFTVAGVDINKNEIECLGKKIRCDDLNNRASVYCESVLDLHFPDKSFMGAIMQGVLATLPPIERLPALLSVKRVLVDGGYLHLAEFELSDDPKFLERYEKDFIITGEFGTLSVKDKNGREFCRSHNFSIREITDLIINAHFEIVNITRRDFVSYHGYNKPGLTIIAQKIIN